MTNSTTKSWPELAVDGWLLGAQMGSVIWLRSMRLMGGGRLAEVEAQRMVSEKFTAGMTLLPALMAGGMSQTAEAMTGRAIAHYAKPVRANQRRLSR